MAAIREELTLVDRFSSTFSRYLTLGEQAAGASTRARSAAANYNAVLNTMDRQLITLNSQFAALTAEQNAMLAAGKRNSSEFAALDARMEKLRGTISTLRTQYDLVEKEANESAQAAKRFEMATRQADTASSSLLGALKGLAGAYLGIQGLRGALNLSDSLTATLARLDRMNDGLQTTAELQDMIWQSAQRSRGAYAGTAAFVAKLGTMAGDAFSSNQELVAFAEQVNKQMVLSGTTAQEAQAAMLQLTQGLSSGMLRGEELNSVLEQTPMIAQTIARYMGVTTGEMRELASQGAVTAQVVKNAMLSAAEETDAAFGAMPMTWGQVWTTMGNVAIKATQPVLNGISWAANHLDLIGPILLAIAASVGVLAGAMLVYNAQQALSNTLAALGAARSALKAGATLAEAAATTTATGAQVGLNIAMLACPITWIVLGIAAVIAILYAAVAAYNRFSGESVSATGIVAGAFLSLGAFILNGTLIPVMNALSAFGNFFANFLNDPVAAVKVLVYDLAITAVGWVKNIVEAIQGLVNLIPGVEVNLSGGVNSIYNKLKAGRQDVIDNSQWTEYFKSWEPIDLKDAWNTGYDWGSNLFQGSGGGGYDASSWMPYSELSAQLGDISGSVASIEKSVDMSQEDLKSLVDAAERRYVNHINLTAQTPVINVSGQNTGRTAADRQSLAEAIKLILTEQRASGSVRSTARPVMG